MTITSIHINSSTSDLASTKVDVSFYDRDSLVAGPYQGLVPPQGHPSLSRIRWYMEEYLRYPDEAATEIAREYRAEFESGGTALFSHIFLENEPAREAYLRAAKALRSVQFEIGANGAAALDPVWEYLRDPERGWLALESRGIVRVSSPMKVPRAGKLPARVLFVISRPGQAQDVPFRSVARPSLEALWSMPDEFETIVLRPPTFEKLKETLALASIEGRPFDIVHFDGHGVFDDFDARAAGKPPIRSEGYVIFEGQTEGALGRYVGGKSLASELAAGGVRLLVLNACRSGYSGASDHFKTGGPVVPSLAAVVAAESPVAVVAMQWSVFVPTAQSFCESFYRSLARGQFLVDAVTNARLDLARSPGHVTMFGLRPMQDWPIAQIYDGGNFRVAPRDNSAARRIDRHPELQLPNPPESGFIGRDADLIRVDRAFDRSQAVQLIGEAGMGKSALAREFVDWYVRSNGLPHGSNRVLWSSFARAVRCPLFEDFASVFSGALRSRGMHPETILNKQQQMDLIVEELSTAPALWVWDNCESIRGPSDFHTLEEDGREYVRLLYSALASSRCKILLTTRRFEDWLAPESVQIALSPMDADEISILLARLMQSRAQSTDLKMDFRSLVTLSMGNPLVATALAALAARGSSADVASIMNEFGENDQLGDEAQRRLQVLKRCYDKTFSARERSQLCILAMFAGFVCCDVVGMMGLQLGDVPGLPPLQGMTADSAQKLLLRLAQTGLATQVVGNNFRLHPVLQAVIMSDFVAAFPEPKVAYAAFCTAMGIQAARYHQLREEGGRGVNANIMEEEANLWCVAERAGPSGCPTWASAAMYTLGPVYEELGWIERWTSLINKIAPLYMNPKTGEPHDVENEDWAQVVHARAQVALARDNVEEALRWQNRRWRFDVDRFGSRTDPAGLQALASSYGNIGNLQMRLGQPEAVASLSEAYRLALLADIPAVAAETALSLSTACVRSSAVPDFPRAREWALKSLSIRPVIDSVGRAKSLAQMGAVELEAAKANQPVINLAAARNYLESALALFPPSVPSLIAPSHASLGMVLARLDARDEAERSLRTAIGLFENLKDPLAAAELRMTLAKFLYQWDRSSEATQYVRAARATFLSLGATDEADAANSILAQIL